MEEGTGVDLTQIRYFLALAKTLNFTRAAEACHVTQPALTKSIQRLEEELGGALLRRERNHTQLTELGIAMHPLLQRTYDAASAARLGALQFRQADTCRLRIGLDPWIPPEVLVPVLREIAGRFATLELSVLQGGSEALNAWLLGGEIDLLIGSDRDGLSERATLWTIFQDRVVVLMPAGHRFSESAPMPVELLCGQVLVGRTDVSGPRAEAALLARLEPAPVLRHCGATSEAVWTVLRAGLGLALGPARQSLPAEIVRRPLDPPRVVDIHVAVMAGRPLSRVADAFIRLARAREWESVAA